MKPVPLRPARRLAGLGVSPIRRISDGAPKDAIPLGLGEPTWELHPAAREALARTSGVLGYGPQAGLVELRSAIATRLGRVPDEVLVTIGTQEGLFDVAQAYLDPGDEALVPDPGFVGYLGVVALTGATPVPYRLAADNRFRLDAAEFARTLDAHPKARLAIVGHPGNPTGGGATAESLRAVAELCQARGVVLVSDEVYRDLHFGAPTPSLLDVSNYGFVLGSTSKGFGAPGLRVGWVLGDAEALAPLRVVHGFAVTSAALPSQRAALALFENYDGAVEHSRRELQLRYTALERAFAAELGQTISPPDGSFYHFLELPEAAWEDPFGFCLQLRDEAKVVLIPGLAFGEAGRRHGRLSFAARPEQIAEGVRRYARFVEGL